MSRPVVCAIMDDDGMVDTLNKACTKRDKMLIDALDSSMQQLHSSMQHGQQKATYPCVDEVIEPLFDLNIGAASSVRSLYPNRSCSFNIWLPGSGSIKNLSVKRE